MQIEKISITGLFGMFNHVIPLNTKEGITIIHGPNGFGKTTILRILYDLFGSRSGALTRVPFSQFRVDFSPQIFLIADRLNTSVSFHDSEGSTTFNAEIYSSTHIYLIESQRLIDTSYVSFTNDINVTTPIVEQYSNKMKDSIGKHLTEYGVVSQSLDRTFPSRAFTHDIQPEASQNNLQERIEELEITQSQLIAVGLLEEDSTFKFPSLSQIFTENVSDTSSKRILSIYVDDAEKKLHVFHDLSKKMELFQRIINQKFSCSHKEIDFSKNDGFVLKVKDGTFNSEGADLRPIHLSSGEQHELIMLYELLFKIEPGSLVLIDEPELSLHVGWQVDFLKDLQAIIKLTNIQILMATHSPDIIQDRWDLTVELKGPQA